MLHSTYAEAADTGKAALGAAARSPTGLSLRPNAVAEPADAALQARLLRVHGRSILLLSRQGSR